MRSIVAIVVAIIVLKYAFHFDILGLLKNPAVRGRFEAVFGWTRGVWADYLLPAGRFVLAHLIVAGEFIWNLAHKAFLAVREWGLKFYPEFLRFW